MTAAPQVAPGKPRVQVIAPAALGATAIEALRRRGIAARAVEPDAVDASDLLAWAFDAIPSLATTVELASICAGAARANRPACLLVPEPRGTGRAALERHAAIAYLRAHGAAIGHDVDAWLESIVCLVYFGLPPGARTAVIAPEGSWLEHQAIALANDMLGAGTRPPGIAGTGARTDPSDAVLYDPALGPPPASLPGSPLVVPVIARGELATATPALFHARGAVGAIEVLGRAAERVSVGLGPAPREASAELAIDRERLARGLQHAQQYFGPGRIADHEVKTLLSAYKVEITRQAVAQTPTGAIKIAKKAGYPVEIKPYARDILPEPQCIIERGVATDAMVRHAYAAIAQRVGGDPSAVSVIVRETPPQGREISVSLLRLPSVGWTCVVDAAGRLAAAPCPLRLLDAELLAQNVIASRAGDPEPDRVGLANLLRRTSHLVVDLDERLVRLELPRVVVGGRGVRTLVVDAFAELA